jgi:hypothetical protein
MYIRRVFSLGGGSVELAFGWRHARGAFETVSVAEQAEVDGATVDLAEVDVIRAAIRCGQIFEQENIEEAAQEGVALDVLPEGLALGGEFLLDAADEDAFHIHIGLRGSLPTAI